MIAQWDSAPLMHQFWIVAALLLSFVALVSWINVWRTIRKQDSSSSDSNNIFAGCLTLVLLLWLAIGNKSDLSDSSISPEDGRVVLVHLPEVQHFLLTQTHAFASNAVQIVGSDKIAHTVEYEVGDYDESKGHLITIWHRFRVNTTNRQVTILVEGPNKADWITLEKWRDNQSGANEHDDSTQPIVRAKF
jgi:hypothetical protein